MDNLATQLLTSQNEFNGLKNHVEVIADMMCIIVYLNLFYFIFALDQKPVLFTPPPVITLKKKKALGSPMNPFSVQTQTPKVLIVNFISFLRS